MEAPDLQLTYSSVRVWCSGTWSAADILEQSTSCGWKKKKKKDRFPALVTDPHISWSASFYGLPSSKSHKNQTGRRFTASHLASCFFFFSSSSSRHHASCLSLRNLSTPAILPPLTLPPCPCLNLCFPLINFPVLLLLRTHLHPCLPSLSPFIYSCNLSLSHLLSNYLLRFRGPWIWKTHL